VYLGPVSAIESAERPEGGWTFVTTHTLVLLCIAEDQEVRLGDIAERVGVTERRVQSIVAELEAAGYLTHTRQGRRNHYSIHWNLPLRHLETEHRRLGDLLVLLTSQAQPSS
jgi:predicted ArsR family transcriptional regulator